MRSLTDDTRLEVFTTCPLLGGLGREDFLQTVLKVARWSEDHGCKGILVYTDNSLLDPWLVSHLIMQNTTTLCPLVAVQPIYMHPYWVAKTVASMGYLYGRRVYLNMVAGGFKNDLTAMNDTTPHDKRYDRLVEYTTIIKKLLADGSPVSYEGEFYKVDHLKLMPPLHPDLFPGILISGSSDAGLAAGKAIGATVVKYPEPPGEMASDIRHEPVDSGIRVGVIARENEDEAWEIAYARFPEDRKGQLTHQLAMKTSDSSWHQQLSRKGQDTRSEKSNYWLTPFQHYKTFCPYLVGSYERVAKELARYLELGHRTLILDIPACEEDLHHTNRVLSLAQKWLVSA